MKPYTPNIQDFERIRVRPDTFKVSGDGVFATLQGEGVTAGEPAVFLRLHFCNLSCGANRGWKCDTWYTWDRTRHEYWQEPQNWTLAETVLNIETVWKSKFADKDVKRLVITGGEPLLQQEKIVQLIKLLPNWVVEIETNGTIVPLKDLDNCQFNCSPKLDNSGNVKSLRYRPDVLKMINGFSKSQFKFVVVSLDDLGEIEQIVRECELLPRKVLVMPEGQTKEEVNKHAEEISIKIKEKGWQLTFRNQLIWFGPKRRT